MWLMFLAPAVALGIVALNALAYRHARAMMRFTAGDARTREPEGLTPGEKVRVLLRGVNIPRPRSDASPVELGPEAVSLRLEGDGIALGAWYCPVPGEKPLVILFHGYSSEKASLLPEARALREMGFPVLLVDFRGSGDSSESYTTIGYDEAGDVALAVDYARAHLPHRKVVLYGQSMGAAAILRAVHACGVRPDAIVAEAVFDTMRNTVRHRFRSMGLPSFPGAELLVFWGGRQAGFDGFRHDPVRYAASVACPILFLHGEADPRARVEDARRVFAAVPAPKRFEEFPAVGHESTAARFPAEWKEAVGGFLRERDDARIAP